MTRHRPLIIVSLIALLLAGLASWAAYNYLKNETEKAKAANERGEVVVASANLPVGTRLDATHLTVSAWPKGNIPPGSFTAPTQLVGRTLVRQIATGDLITEQKLMPAEGTPGAGVMTYLVPRGHRAVTVGVNEVAGVAGFLSPNNRVDVVLTTTPPGATEPLTKIVLQDVPILAIGQMTEQKDGKPVVVPTVTMDLTPDDAERLVLASTRGPLQLLLRNIVDTAPVISTGATIRKVLGGTTAAPPRVASVRNRKARSADKPVQPRLYTIELIKGNSKSIKEFAPE